MGGERVRVFTSCQAIKPVYNIFRHNRKPLIFQWAFTLQNAGIGSGSIPVFHPLKN